MKIGDDPFVGALLPRNHGLRVWSCGQVVMWSCGHVRLSGLGRGNGCMALVDLQILTGMVRKCIGCKIDGK